MDFKLWVLQGHYQSERDFSFENLEAARVRRLNWRNRIALCYQHEGKDIDFTPILTAVSDNLNSPKACALIDEIKDESLHFWEQVDVLFGLRLYQDSPDITIEQKHLLALRSDAKVKKYYAEADRIRDELLAQGIAIKDTTNGQIWQYSR